MSSFVTTREPIPERQERGLTVYPDQTNVPRDLRSAEQLAAGGYAALGPVVAWLEVRLPRTATGSTANTSAEDRGGNPTKATHRVALHSTSEARRLKGYAWTWPQRGALRGASPPGGAKADGPSSSQRTAAGARTKPRVLDHHTPLLARRRTRPSLQSDPRRWLTELFREGFVVIDTETTGLGARDEVIEIAAVGPDGAVLFQSLVRPKCGYVPAASARIHGLSYGDVANAPGWPEVVDELFRVVSGHRLLAWNAGFDERLCAQSSRTWGLPHPLPGFECAMRAYARCRGVGSGSMRLERAASVEGVLTAGQAHRSADDARLTVSVLRRLQRSSAAA